MVTEIDKLKKVIDSLEEQANEVANFNGVLSSIMELKNELERISKVGMQALNEATSNSNVSKTYLEGYASNFQEIEKRMAAFELSIEKLKNQVHSMDFVSSSQFDTHVKDSNNFFEKNFEALKSNLEQRFSSLKNLVLVSALIIGSFIGYLAYLAI